ncbi:MAG: molybdopterin dinucleotide binding domain-containing protein, partial [Pseudomonadota bacterium]
SLPEADAVAAAIRACPFVAVSDIVTETETNRAADVLLPAAAWGEKSGTVTNSERRITRQRPFLPIPGKAREDWRIICDVARAMGWGAAFDYASPAEIFREHAALSGVAARLGRDFDISGLAGLDDRAYDALAPVQWPVPAAEGVPAAGRADRRFFAEGGFYTPARRARLLPVVQQAPASALTPAYPLRLNTGRVRDHWHTMTRTARSARLSRHFAEPFVEIHPADAAEHGIEPAHLARIESPHGALVVRALVTDRVRPGMLFVPMHWTAAWSSEGRAGAAVGGIVDPVSGQPDAKAQPVRIRPFEATWYGFAVSRNRLEPDTAYWARARIGPGWQAEIADTGMPEDWTAFAMAVLGAGSAAGAVTVEDPARGLARVAVLEEGRVTGALFVSRAPVEIARAHVLAAFEAGQAAEALLAGRPAADRPDPGATLCSCFNVGVNTVMAAIATDGLADLEEIGRALRAGTNCGSCRPELAALLEAAARRVAAE